MFAIPSLIAFVTSPLGKGVAILGVIAAVFFAGDIRGRRIEHAKCEAAARKAQDAADKQDQQAGVEVRDSENKTLAQLSEEKRNADAKVAVLEKQLSVGPLGAPCLYGRLGAPADFVRPSGNANPGTGHPLYTGAPRVPTTRERPPGH